MYSLSLSFRLSTDRSCASLLENWRGNDWRRLGDSGWFQEETQIELGLAQKYRHLQLTDLFSLINFVINHPSTFEEFKFIIFPICSKYWHWEKGIRNKIFGYIRIKGFYLKKFVSTNRIWLDLHCFRLLPFEGCKRRSWQSSQDWPGWTWSNSAWCRTQQLGSRGSVFDWIFLCTISRKWSSATQKNEDCCLLVVRHRPPWVLRTTGKPHRFAIYRRVLMGRGWNNPNEGRWVSSWSWGSVGYRTWSLLSIRWKSWGIDSMPIFLHFSTLWWLMLRRCCSFASLWVCIAFG